MALYKFNFPLVVLVEQELGNSCQGGTSTRHAVHETEEVDEAESAHENLDVEQEVAEEAQPMVHEQPQQEVDDNEEEIGLQMNADQGELDETIVDQMELDDEEYRTFVEG
ncbi:hypothetical protein C2845_PM09G12850 [Panicum miliaceum]|uniref:Uncharacterized protein n=1 Tax=Panicum miliaceum TaxID=4540 RepID=A0A3L6S230_PANMI|nr:hypothetical protein C2845_PM09G12850 [Panicum miliaceum]